MRLNILGLLSYLFLVLIVLAVFLFRNTAAEWVVRTPEKEAASVELENTLVTLNRLYEDHLNTKLDELERQRQRLQQQLQDNDSNDADIELLRELNQLQSEKARLEGEINFIQYEASTMQDEKVESDSEDLFKQLDEAESRINELIAENDEYRTELNVLNVVLSDKDGESSAFQDEIKKLSGDLTLLKQQLNSALDNNKALNTEIAALSKTFENEKTADAALKNKIGALESDIENSRIESENLRSRLENLTNERQLLDEEVQRKNDLLQAQEAERLSQEALFEQQLKDLNEKLERAASEIAERDQNDRAVSEADAVRTELNEIIDKLFSVSGIMGVFINNPDGTGLQMVVNPNAAETAAESPFMLVHSEDGAEFSKISISDADGDFQYRVFPGYPEPEEGNWF